MDTATNPPATPLQQTPYEALRTVTPFSRVLALALFVLLPFLGAYVGHKLGMSYQQLLSSSASPQQPPTSQIDTVHDSGGVYPSSWSYTESISFTLPEWAGKGSLVVPFTQGGSAESAPLRHDGLFKNIRYEQDTVSVGTGNQAIVRLYPRSEMPLETQLENITVVEENQPEAFRELFYLDTETATSSAGQVVSLVSDLRPQELFDTGIWTNMSYVVFESFIVGVVAAPQDPESIRVDPSGIKLIN